MSGKDENKVYYWMAMKKDFFDRPAMLQLLHQENAWEYIGLYIQLCLQTINSQGYLVSKIGKKIFPFTEEMIAWETKYHSEEFVVKALELFADLELVKIGYKGYKYIPEVQESIGSSSNGKSAKYKDKERARKKLEESFDNFFEIAVSDSKTSTDAVDKISTDAVDKTSTDAVDKISTDDWTKCPPQYTDYSIQITDNRNTIIDDVDLKNDRNLIHLSVERDAEESLKNCKSKNAKELLNALASPKTNWDTIIPVEYIRECEAYTTPEIADKEYMLLKKVKNSFNKRDSKTISLATSEQVYSILDAVKAVVTGEMETPVMNQSGYIANCFRNTFRL